MASTKTPAVRQLRYEIANSAEAGTETSHYVDIARDLAAINRRMMAQGRVYHIGKITVVSRNTIAGITHENASPVPGSTVWTQNAGFISVSAAPYSWTVINAAKNGAELFKKMRKKAMEASPGALPGRYDDFKIRALHSGATSPTFLTPVDNGGNALSLGEWDYSTFVSPDGSSSSDSYTCHLLGGHAGSAGNYTSIGLVQSFGDTRATVQNLIPGGQTNSDDPLANLFDDGTQVDEILDGVATNNDNPPYDRTNYAGQSGNMPRPIVMQHGTLGADGRVTLGGFKAVHGLLEFEVTSPVAGDVYSVLVELKEGSYKGIAAEAL